MPAAVSSAVEVPVEAVLGRGHRGRRPLVVICPPASPCKALSAQRTGAHGVVIATRIPGGSPCSLHPRGQRVLAELCQRLGWRFAMEAIGGLVSRGSRFPAPQRRTAGRALACLTPPCSPPKPMLSAPALLQTSPSLPLGSKLPPISSWLL